jgi:hypothetical protein
VTIVGEFFPASKQISKRLVAKNMAEPVARLPQQLLAMSQEQ